MSRRAAILVFVGALVLIDALGRLLTGSSPSLIEEAPSPPASPVAASADAVRAGFAPLLDRATADARMLVELGERKERNLFRIRAAQTEMEASLAAADAWLAANPVPKEHEAAVAAYREGAASIRAAMAEAQAGFLRLDFDRVARAAATMRDGEAALGDATLLLGGDDP